MGGALLIGTLSDGSRGTKRGVAMVMGVLAGSAANEALNVAVGRARPADGGDPWHFDPFEGHAAFPSGHAAYAFAVAGAIDAATDSWVPAAMAYAAATLTGASRIYDDRHWLSDVAIGALVGGWTAARVTRAAMDALGVSSRQDPLTASRSWLERVAPVATAGFVGLRVQF
jgi:membrane-associated phospholipid phosphatase